MGLHFSCSKYIFMNRKFRSDDLQYFMFWAHEVVSLESQITTLTDPTRKRSKMACNSIDIYLILIYIQ